MIGTSDLSSENVLEDKEESLLHLFVLVHGIFSSDHGFDFWEQHMKNRGREHWEILKVASITKALSFRRQINPCINMQLQDLVKPLVDEVVPWVWRFAQKRRKLRLHFVCHSLGGLIVRTALPTLCGQLDKLYSLELGHFLTLNSPHIGVQPSPYARLRWKHFVNFKDMYRQVILRDEERFLTRLADPGDKFVHHLAKFRYRTAVGATHWDFAVPFCSAVICAENPFQRPIFGSPFCRLDAATGFESEKMTSLQAQLVKQGSVTPAEEFALHVHNIDSEMMQPGATTHESWKACKNGSLCFPSQMLNGLASVGWRRVAYTLHWTGKSPHTISIGKPSCDRSRQLVGFLIDVLEDGI